MSTPESKRFIVSLELIITADATVLEIMDMITDTILMRKRSGDFDQTEFKRMYIKELGEE